MKLSKHASGYFLSLILLALGLLSAGARPVHLLVIGNSFSLNATHYLPELAREGGYELVIARAQIWGGSLAEHWNALAADLANPNDVHGKVYDGKSLREIMGGEKWDIITIQQYSLLSANTNTYHPFAEKFCAELRKLQPWAEIVVHQTWAYRSDSETFGQVENGKTAANEQEMWEKSRAAYWQLAAEQQVRLIPTGDAFWRIDSDPQWGYQPDKGFDFKHARPPALPSQKNSLHRGYQWSADQKLNCDTHHASAAGEYLGALVWYGFLFKESPEKLAFVPGGIESSFAGHLREVAWTVVRESVPASAAASQKKDPAAH